MSRPTTDESQICRLCLKRAGLRQSHLIPSFFPRWLKKTGSTAFRAPVNPNVRLKETASLRLLCQECEQRLSKFETYFCRTAFYPIVEKRTELFEYDYRLALFALSLVWRCVVAPRRREQDSRVVAAALAEREPVWRQHLLDGTPPVGERMHMVVMHATPGFTPVKFWHSFLERAADMTVAHTERGEPGFVYAKLGPFQFYAPIGSLRSDAFERAEISPEGGRYEPGWSVGPQPMDFLIRRAKEVRELTEGRISPKQRERSQRAMMRSLDANSLHARVLALDLLSEPQLAVGQDRPGRNSPCFCGSGKKFKRCHGGGGGGHR